MNTGEKLYNTDQDLLLVLFFFAMFSGCSCLAGLLDAIIK